MEYAAHLLRAEGEAMRVQTVQAHCRASAEYARAAAGPALGQLAYLAGLLHDMGKFTAVFQTYLDAASRGLSVRRGSVNHTFAGVRFVMERWHGQKNFPRQALTSELLAFGLGSHHGEFDCLSPEGDDGFAHRLTFDDALYFEARGHFLTDCAGETELDALFEAACKEVAAAVDGCAAFCKNRDELLFYISLLGRRLLSAVIDGDRRDTADFFAVRPPAPAAPDWGALLAKMESDLDQLPARLPIDAVRRQISDRCRLSAGAASGVFRLTVPTGGGKTLTALRYSLACAAAGKRRIFFVIPLLSVLEQNARVLHDWLGESCPILEHHSNVIRERAEKEKLDENELLMENWSAPIVITTLVQLLDTLFSQKTSCIRRMAALQDSVIVIDEVQSVPIRMLALFNLALNFLAICCGATIVLCSATQPALDTATHAVRYAPSPELVKHDPALWQQFRRTRIEDRRRAGGYTAQQLAQLAVEQAADTGSALLICNTKAEARNIFRAIAPLWEQALFHLSTGMCTAHRQDTLAEINHALADRQPVICVASQLVEAGIDFSFGCVVRILAGMDNIVQAAGRCNRNGEAGLLGPVLIVNLHGESLGHLPDIRRAQQAAESLLLSFERAPAQFDDDLTGARAIRTYYQTLYGDLAGGAQDYPVKKLGTTLFDLLSYNKTSRRQGTPAYTLGQAFATAGRAFAVFDDNTTDVLVPYKGGGALIEKLASEQARYDLAFRGRQLQKSGAFTVSLFDYQLRQLEEQGLLVSLLDGAVLTLLPEAYSLRFGVTLGSEDEFFEEVQHGSQKFLGV